VKRVLKQAPELKEVYGKQVGGIISLEEVPIMPLEEVKV